MPSLPRRAIIAVTSATAPLHNGQPTGLFISEALHPYNVFTAAGFEVDLVSEKGTYVADWLSLQDSFLNGEDKKEWEDVNGEFRRKLDNMPDVHTIDGSKVSTWAVLEGAAGAGKGRAVKGQKTKIEADDYGVCIVRNILCERRTCCAD